MAKAPGIPDFTDKLGLVLDRLNWSRAQLAQRVGVDKSVAQRWAAGQMVPGGASLVALTAAIQAAVADFGRAGWRLPIEGFAARLGVAAAVEPGAAAMLFPRIAAMAAATLDSATACYAGFRLLVHASVQTPERPGAVWATSPPSHRAPACYGCRWRAACRAPGAPRGRCFRCTGWST
mgnify:FL=1